jgi:integrase
MKKPTDTAPRRRAWSYIAGERGRNRVRVFAWPKQGESLWIDCRDGAGRTRKPLGHSDKDRAKRQADEVAARWGQDKKARPAVQVLTLRTLFDIYEREVTPQKGKSARGHDRRALPLLLKAFGADRRPETLNVRDWQGFIKRRQSGELAPQLRRRKKLGKSIPKPVRATVIEQNLKLLLAVLNWAERAQHPDGSGYLLERNPLRGLKLPKEENPRQPIFTADQCKALRRVAAEHSPLAERFVMMAWYTGHRSNSIRQLRWSDLDLEGGNIRWRAEADKIGYEHRNPMHPDLLAFLKQDRLRSKAIGEAHVFPALRDSSQPLPRDTVQKVWATLAKAASIPRGVGYGWHSFRRAFANALRDVPLRELKDLGGWKSTATIVKVYLQPSEQAQRTALSKLATSNGQ